MRKLTLLIVFALTGCGSAALEPAPPTVETETDDAYVLTGEHAAAGLSDTERERMGNSLAMTPLPPDAKPEAPLSELVDFDMWRQMPVERRTRLLRHLQARGSSWASEVLAHGGYDSLSREADAEVYSRLRFELDRIETSVQLREEWESLEQARSRYGGVMPGGYGGDRMPFGKSMFGPWDTGSGYAGR